MLFSAQEIALALIALGRGATYRAAAAEMREHAGRFPVEKKGTRYTRHGQLAADMVELFAPVVFAPHAPTAWPTKTLVLDQIPFRVRDFHPNGRPKPGGTVAFNVFGALGHDEAGRGFVWHLEAFHTASANDWEQFLRALPGAPKRVVCDAHDGIGNAVRRVFPAADLYLCEWHLREKLRLRLTRAKANTPAELAWRRLERACHSDHGWGQSRRPSVAAGPSSARCAAGSTSGTRRSLPSSPAGRARPSGSAAWSSPPGGSRSRCALSRAGSSRGASCSEAASGSTGC